MPNLLLQRIEIETEIVINFDGAEICIQQGIDASAKKSPGRPKGSKTARTKVLQKKHGNKLQSVKAQRGRPKQDQASKAARRINANRATAQSSGFAAFSQGKKQKKTSAQKAERTAAMAKALAKRQAKQKKPKGTGKPSSAKSAAAHRQRMFAQQSNKQVKKYVNKTIQKSISGTGKNAQKKPKKQGFFGWVKSKLGFGKRK